MDIEKVIREYIDKSLHMSLATAVNNKPWVCEVHFVYDNDLNLYFRSLPTRRHSQEIELRPNVAGNIVAQHMQGEYPHAIYFEGTAALLDNKSEQQEVFPLFQTRLGIDQDALQDAQKPDGHKFYKITVGTWYAFGKFGGSNGQKYELHWNDGKRG